MGGHGGLNILPQKRWNVYNYENREKVRRDEEAAAKEEQLKREQARKRDAESRLEQLRASRGLAPVKRADATSPGNESEPKSGHINLFEGIKIFDPLEKEGGDEKNGPKKKKMRKEDAATKVVNAEDEKYRLGYGVAGKGVKLPWYLERRSGDANANANVNAEGEDSNGSSRVTKEVGKKSGKKTVEELREERLKRERREKEKERALLMEKSRRDGGFSRERKHSRRV
ncbi:leukocyte receptor cluster member 1 homolog [Morus notabilis]|nr:leukocyte receptor cluster member 1 homolog [Morus notabilis]XP_024030820.1 leukocyte receptor cluster member 1 homolog [Morus notabilis]XP_024030821.1 leukocyte receptor cluster member 1 homolog [Morus notabilis]XP_024030822.1 leukocyte receptor cluster member 1 homolog [Morus notabilis]